jgi:hypothetical protein
MVEEFKVLLICGCRMFRIVGRAALCVAILFVAACSTPAVPFDRAASPDVKRIGIVDPGFPDGASVALASTVGQSFGPLGVLIDAGMESNRESGMAALVQKRQFQAKAEYMQALHQALSGRGYEVVDVAAPRKTGEFVEPAGYPHDAPVDAYLDTVVWQYGFVSAGMGSSTPYRPVVFLKCRLVSAKDPKQILMFDTILLNPVNPPKEAIQISALPDYTFVDFDALMADPPRTTEALTKVVDQSADTVGKVLE